MRYVSGPRWNTNTVGYEQLFALLFLFDVVAAAVLWVFIGRSHGPIRTAVPAE